MKHIILASASPRRKEILELADLKFDVMPSDAQEITTKTAPNEVVMELASIKAKDIYKKSEKQSMVVGACRLNSSPRSSTRFSGSNQRTATASISTSNAGRTKAAPISLTGCRRN